MEDGIRNWNVLWKLLLDNQLERAAMCAYTKGIGAQMFVRRAQVAYSKVEMKVDLSVQAANDAREELQSAIRKAAAAEDESEAMTKTKEAEQPSVAMTLDFTDEPEEPK